MQDFFSFFSVYEHNGDNYISAVLQNYISAVLQNYISAVLQN